MVNLTKGAEALATAVEGSTQARVAAQLGVTQQTVSDWVRGTKTPKGENLLALEAKFGIAPKAWFEKSRARKPRAA